MRIAEGQTWSHAALPIIIVCTDYLKIHSINPRLRTSAIRLSGFIGFGI